VRSLIDETTPSQYINQVGHLKISFPVVASGEPLTPSGQRRSSYIRADP